MKDGKGINHSIACFSPTRPSLVSAALVASLVVGFVCMDASNGFLVWESTPSIKRYVAGFVVFVFNSFQV